MRALEKNNISMHCILASLYFLMLPLTISVNSTGASFLKLATIPISIYFLISLLKRLKKVFQMRNCGEVIPVLRAVLICLMIRTK